MSTQDETGNLSKLSDFIGLYPQKDSLKERIWEESIIVLDTSVLANLYRYKRSVSEEFLSVLELLSDRTWITSQVAYEFLRNRENVRREQLGVYSEVERACTEIIARFKEKMQPLRIGERHSIIETTSFEAKLLEVISEFKEQLHQWRKEEKDDFQNDKILSAIENLIGNKVYLGFDYGKIEELVAEGNERFDKNIPPGYADLEKTDIHIIEGMPVPAKFGDLIVWKELLALSIAKSSSIIFVTDELKEDWIWKAKGETVGPRPELTQEFKKETGKDFALYGSARFLSFASEKLKKPVNVETTQYVRSIAEDADRRASVLATQIWNRIRNEHEPDSRSPDPDLAKSALDAVVAQNADLSSFFSDGSVDFDFIAHSISRDDFIGIDVIRSKLGSPFEIRMATMRLHAKLSNGETVKHGMLVCVMSADAVKTEHWLDALNKYENSPHDDVDLVLGYFPRRDYHRKSFKIVGEYYNP